MQPESLKIGGLYKFNEKFINLDFGSSPVGFVNFRLSSSNDIVSIEKNSYFILIDRYQTSFSPKYLALFDNKMVSIEEKFLLKYSELVND